MTNDDRAFDVMERVAAALRAQGASTAIIGAVAMAVHGYARATADIDLASFVPLPTLVAVKRTLEGEGFHVRLSEPDAADPLGGVLTIHEDDGDAIDEDFVEVQVVNFHNPPAGGTELGREAIRTAVARNVGSVPVVDLPHLIALKLYRGGRQSEGDVVELLQRNPDADVHAIMIVCARYELDEPLRAILREIGRRISTSP